MTGFGSGKAALNDGFVVVEIKTVNHRFLEIRSRAPRELLYGEALVERLIRERLDRGYCSVNLWYEGSLGGSTAIDRGALRTHLDSLVEVAKEKDLVLTDLVGILAGAPDIFTTPRIDDEAVLDRSIREAFEKAVRSLTSMREIEGEAMAEKLRSLATHLNAQVSRLSEECRGWPVEALSRLKERILNLLKDSGGGKEIDQGRIVSEAALLADRADVTEEITRLLSHLSQMSDTIAMQSPMGRKLEFLIQELGREANTIASKTMLPKVSEAVIEIKADLEKMREIAQNIE
jgi:uncharacterized protein (TIGR00255 family)